MRTNLLKINKLPSTIYSLLLDLTYRDVIQLFKSKPIYFHLYRNKLYFIGDPELVEATLRKEDIEVNTSKIEVDTNFLTTNWHIVRVLLYKILRHFLYKQGFSFHTRFRNRVFMVRDKRRGPVVLIYNYSDNSSPAFVHEGFNFFFRLYGHEVFFGINPCVVVTRDGKNCIRAKDLSYNKYREYKRWFIDRRFNSIIKRMLNTFVDLLCKGGTKVIIPVFNGEVEIDGRVVEIG